MRLCLVEFTDVLRVQSVVERVRAGRATRRGFPQIGLHRLVSRDGKLTWIADTYAQRLALRGRSLPGFCAMNQLRRQEDADCYPESLHFSSFY